jgi:hypothetical protein
VGQRLLQLFKIVNHAATRLNGVFRYTATLRILSASKAQT